MSKKIIVSLLFLLTLHIIISLAFIVFPSLLGGTRFSRVYKTNLMPGPFFSDTRIINSYMLSLTWKINDQWSSPRHLAKESFDDYDHSLNPSNLYRGRFERSMYQRLSLETNTKDEIQNKREFKLLREYLVDNYIPAEADSFRVVITRKQAKNRTIKTDTLHVFTLD